VAWRGEGAFMAARRALAPPAPFHAASSKNLPLQDFVGECDLRAKQVVAHGRGKPCHSHDTASQADPSVSWEWRPLRAPGSIALSLSFANKVLQDFVGE